MTFASPQLELSEESREGVHVIVVRGEVHVTTAPELSALLNESIAAGRHRVVVDMAGVEFIDSTGLSVLLNALRRVTRAKGRMALVVSNPTVLRLFEITRLDSTFTIRPERDEAVAAAQAGPSTSGAP